MTGFLPVGYDPHKPLNVWSHKLLAHKDDILSKGDIDDEEKMFAQEFCDIENAYDMKFKKEEKCKK